jgi:hypothetical protein
MGGGGVEKKVVRMKKRGSNRRLEKFNIIHVIFKKDELGWSCSMHEKGIYNFGRDT